MKSLYSPAIWQKLQGLFSDIVGYSPSARVPLFPSYPVGGCPLPQMLKDLKNSYVILFGLYLILYSGEILLLALGQFHNLHFFSVVMDILFVDLLFLLGTLACRPLYEERFQTKERTRMISPIAATYLLIALLSHVVDYIAFRSSLLSAIIIPLLASVLMLSLLLFEREQVRLAMDENTRSKAILLNGEVVSDGVPTGFVASVGTLLIIAVTEIPNTLRKICNHLLAC